MSHQLWGPLAVNLSGGSNGMAIALDPNAPAFVPSALCSSTAAPAFARPPLVATPQRAGVPRLPPSGPPSEPPPPLPRAAPTEGLAPSVAAFFAGPVLPAAPSFAADAHKPALPRAPSPPPPPQHLPMPPSTRSTTSSHALFCPNCSPRTLCPFHSESGDDGWPGSWALPTCQDTSVTLLGGNGRGGAKFAEGIARHFVADEASTTDETTSETPFSETETDDFALAPSNDAIVQELRSDAARAPQQQDARFQGDFRPWRLCAFWRAGKPCPKERECRFAHGRHELGRRPGAAAATAVAVAKAVIQ